VAKGDPPGDNGEAGVMFVGLAPGDGACTARRSTQVSLGDA